MIFSRYNFLLDSSKHGFFIYNSVFNSFFKTDHTLFNLLKGIQDKPELIVDIEPDLLGTLVQNKILVTEHEDDNYITKKKYVSYANAFSEDSLGIVLVPTMNCNFACSYCYEHNLPTDIMDTQTQNKVVEFIESFECAKDSVQLCWHGGEPLLAFSAMESLLEKIYSNNNINVTRHDLVTNGYLLTKEKVKVLKKYNLGSVQITIDGVEEEHNKSRPLKSGLPTYHKIIENVEYLLDNYKECFVNIRINVHENNKEKIHLIYSELKNKWSNYNCNIYMVYVSTSNHCKVKCVKMSERVSFFKDLYKKHDIKDIDFFPENEPYGCSATNQNSYVVGPDGELYKCWVDVGKPKCVIGTIEDKLTNLPLISEYLVGTDMFSDEKCLDCFMFPTCDGGCNLTRFESKQKKEPINNCPINKDDFSTLLELHYEKQISI